jgi:4-alpha-glucanotransferase
MSWNETIFPRSSGVLLHPTSLPGRYGAGDLGEWSYRFVDWLESAGQAVWQVLPLGPTSYGDSPYQCLSAFAGNPLLISFDRLKQDGWLTEADVVPMPTFSAYAVDYGPVIEYHEAVLGRAFTRFSKLATPSHRAAFEAWCAEQAYWLEDYALFIAIKQAHGGRPWVEWAEGLALRDTTALAEAATQYASAILEQKFRQWLFFQHWTELKAYANGKGIRIVGDIPIFVAHDSADVWANTDLFYLDAKGQPTVVAGVPPDYFAVKGQYWGNPLYRWDKLKTTGYAWWIRRVAATLKTVDIVRVDHFRGFEAYWEVQVNDELSAVDGEWIPGPKFDLFTAIKAALGDDLPIIAEDLGLITPGVIELRDGLGLPGMKILQFAFGGAGGENSFLPHNYTPNCVVYTGTHDNNTTLGWWMDAREVPPEVRNFVPEYLGHAVTEIQWDLIRLGMSSVAHTFVVPMQDVFGFGADTRMNTPGKQAGNWQWRFAPEWLTKPDVRDRLAYLTRLYGRWPKAAAT